MAKPPRIGPKWRPRDVKNPINWVGCDEAVAQIQTLIGGEIVMIQPKSGKFLGLFMDTAEGWRYHRVVVKDGRVYDPFTGAQGMSIVDYKALWQYTSGIDFGF